MSLRVRPAVPCRSHTAREIRRSRVTAFVEPCPSSPCLSGVVSNELLPQQPSLRLARAHNPGASEGEFVASPQDRARKQRERTRAESRRWRWRSVGIG